MLLPIRVPINWGYAVFDAMGQYERVGDRQVPAEILVSFPGTGDQPSLRMTLTAVSYTHLTLPTIYSV